MSKHPSPLSTLRTGGLLLALFLAGCGQGVDDLLARTWCSFDGEAEAPFLRAQGYRVGPGLRDAETAEAMLEEVAPELSFVASTMLEARFHRDGTLEVTERDGEQWQSRYEFISANEIVYLDPEGREVREGVVVDGNTLALIRLNGGDGYEVRRFVRALPIISC